MIKCLETCKKLKTSCPVKDCRYWINYEEEYNCVFDSISRHDSMTLRQIGERLGISYVRVKQIADEVLNKISHLF
jgi:hypothetical protein